MTRTGPEGRAATHRLDGAAVVLGAAGLLAVGAVASTAARGVEDPAVALVFGLLIGVGELIRLRLPDDRVQAPIGLAGALGYALLSHLPADVRPTHAALQVVAVTAVGMLLGTLPHVLAGRTPELEGVARRLLVVGALAGIFRPIVVSTGLYDWLDARPPLFVLLTIMVAALAWPIEAAIEAGVRAGRQLAPLPALFRNELRAMLGIGLAIASTGVLIALAAWEVGLWALPIFSIPLLLAQISFRRYTGIRRTQVQTIRALSRSTEVSGYTETGHARRVTTLALAMGREMGMNDEQLRTLEYAALMHDIGQLSLTDPIPGGATVLITPDERRHLALYGGEVIRQTGALDEVARVVEAQAEPYRRPHVPDDIDVPLASRIIKVANAYDDLAGSSDDEGTRMEALERLRLGMAYEYDPRAIESLARILPRLAPARS